ncbi:peptidase inhibitor family I36 protein [Streptomyces sp. NPDC058320]|uniref:peptidase inhibitor family I36 protein n=1 Tax=Streptomyces sp. NPDC058320 TaxID=3346444 RepID=UPI0036E061CC
MTAAAALAAVLLTPVHAGAAVPPTSGDCAAGELCLWEKPEFKGHRQAYELSGIDIESCVGRAGGGRAPGRAPTPRTPRPAQKWARLGGRGL